MLEIFFLGRFEVIQDGIRVEITSHRTRSLFAYLVLNPGIQHRREKLAGILWPDSDRDQARSNLRHTLWRLRKAIGGKYFITDKESIGFDTNAFYELDVDILEDEAIDKAQTEALIQVVSVYRGELLPDFYADWVNLDREGLRAVFEDRIRVLLDRLLTEQRWQEVCHWGERWISFGEVPEAAYRALMIAHCATGETSKIAQVYQRCTRGLEEQLGVEPSQTTRDLFDQLMNAEQLPDRFADAHPPAVLEPKVSEPILYPPQVVEVVVEEPFFPRPIFVGRENELERLDVFLDDVLRGKGGIVCITGGAGRGKTALMREFAWQALQAHPELLLGMGNCNAFAGIGDPFLPFREILDMLTGDLESRIAAGTISREHAQRIWSHLPQTGQVLVELGPSLLDTFVPGKALLSRALAARLEESDWIIELQHSIGKGGSAKTELEQNQLFIQLDKVLKKLSYQNPLLLVLDDMQWADAGSISLLFHLCRRLEGSRVLILCAYRPDELAMGRTPITDRQSTRHPLKKVLNEIKRQMGDIWIDLSEVGNKEGRGFIDAFLNTEPNKLGGAFRRSLFRQTRGHPLFTVELLREMQARGDLIHDEAGYWIEGRALDWDLLPARVEGVIEERIDRLEPDVRELMDLASVEGDRFTLEVLAHAKNQAEAEIIKPLEEELVTLHRLVLEDGADQFDGRIVHRYRFRHGLYQHYLYGHLGTARRQFLHAQIAKALEEIFEGKTDEIAVHLGRHWLRAGKEQKAVDYLITAGDQARMFYAHEEAEQHYQKGVEIYQTRGEKQLAAKTLMKMGLVYTAAFQPEQARHAYREAFALWEPAISTKRKGEIGISAEVLRLAAEEPLTLDPRMSADDVSRFLVEQLFEGLVKVDPENNILPAVAASWDVDRGGERYIFHLHKDLHWSDGEPLTADDFEFAWKWSLNPATKSPTAHYLHPIKNARKFSEGELEDPEEVQVKAIDHQTLEIILETPTAYLPQLLTHPATFPLPMHVIEESGADWFHSENLVSNGTYQLVEWSIGERMTLLRNPYYHGNFPGNADEIECTFFLDYDLAMEAYDSAVMDMVSLFHADPAIILRAETRFPGELLPIPRPVTFYLVFRVDQKPMDDDRLRKAFVHGLDREGLVRVAFQGQRMPALGGFIPPSLPGHSSDIGLAFDVGRALDLLTQAGYPEGRGLVDLNLVHGPGGEDVVSFLCSSWVENLGVEITPMVVDWKTLFDDVEVEPGHMRLMGWSADYPDPDNFLRLLFHSKQGKNRARWFQARFNKLVEEATQITDHTRRMEMYREADRILVAIETVVMPLTYGQGRMLIKPQISLPQASSISIRLKNFVIQRKEE